MSVSVVDDRGSEPSLVYRKSSDGPRGLHGVGRLERRKIQAKEMVLQNAFLFFLSFPFLHTKTFLIIE